MEALCGELCRQSDTDAIIKKVAGGLIRMVYTCTAAYDYDRLAMPATFPKFRMALDVTPENTDEAAYLFLKTDFLRQRNRLMDEMEYICDEIELAHLRWNANRK